MSHSIAEYSLPFAMDTNIFFCIQFICLAFITIRTGAHDAGQNPHAGQNPCATNPGWYTVLVENAGISSMHTIVTRFNTVVMMDRTDIGASQLNLPPGVCRYDANDQSLKEDCTAHSAVLELYGNTIRPLEILTDTWCSSGQYLPDGTILHTGGFNDGAQKFRTLVPCAADGNCDWLELDNPTLYNGRWYSTDQILPDGSVIMIGGIGISSLEYWPQKPGGAVFFPLLSQTVDDQNDNLYPYCHLLPTGTLFIFSNTQAVEYDYTIDKIIRAYPALEGGPRNYPSAGSSVMLALEGDYSTATVVVCGGSQYNAYLNNDIYAAAQKSCGRIVATDPNPYWEMDDMPLARNMGDMVILFTGDVVIINGAQAGSQGYELATDPCLTPVLYEPHKDLGYRFTMLATGTIPRLYHSTASLLPDGRILLAGSSTHYYYTFTGLYPTELRIEAFSPGYLAPEYAYLQPVLMIVPYMMGYGQAIAIDFTMPSVPNLMTLEVNMASAPFTTHSYAQGQRVIKLVVTSIQANANGYTVGCISPPNSKVAPPSYYMVSVVSNKVPSAAQWSQLVA